MQSLMWEMQSPSKLLNLFAKLNNHIRWIVIKRKKNSQRKILFTNNLQMIQSAVGISCSVSEADPLQNSFGQERIDTSKNNFISFFNKPKGFHDNQLLRNSSNKTKK